MELETKIRKQRLVVIKLRQELDGKWLEKQIQVLGNRLNTVSEQFVLSTACLAVLY